MDVHCYYGAAFVGMVKVSGVTRELTRPCEKPPALNVLIDAVTPLGKVIVSGPVTPIWFTF